MSMVERHRRANFALALSLTTLVLAGQASAQENSGCSLQRYVSADMRTEPEGRVTVPTTINGRTMPFMIDTGGWFGGISNSVATAMHLPLRPFMFAKGFYYGHLQYIEFYGGEKMTQEVELDSYSLGALTANQVEIPVMPNGLLADNVDGLIGPNVLSHYDIDLDFYKGKLNIFAPNSCPAGVVYWTTDTSARIPIHVDKEDWAITVPVTLDGQSFRATMDTGAAMSTMTLDRAQKLFGMSDSDYRLKRLRDGAYRFPFSQLAIGNVVVNNPQIDLIPRREVVSGAPDLLLGMDVLRQLHLYIAYKEQALYVTSAEAH